MTSLYRKYRPSVFEEVFGQDHIIKTISNQILKETINHAYLFCGTRGTGKTSTAKIFAKAINCENRVGASPCGVCESCQSIVLNRSTNVIEIDAASNNGVDNIRDIIEEVKYPPAQGRYKVYIIDEVHMLSIGAFNALLKTLEEPPNHVVFILATTDPHKVPQTILSRVQRYDFRRVSEQDISDKLTYYCTLEAVNITPEAINFVARLADGSVRDALSILGQVLSFFEGDEMTEEKVRALLGVVDTAVLFDLTDAIYAKDFKVAIECLAEITNQGREMAQLVNEMILHLRNLLVAKYSGTDLLSKNMSSEQIGLLLAQSEQMEQHGITRILDGFIGVSAKMKYEKNQKILLEILIIKLCQDEVVVAPVKIEKKQQAPQEKGQAPVHPKAMAPTRQVDASVSAMPSGEASVSETQWRTFVEQQDALLKNLLKTCEIKSAGSRVDIVAADINYNLLKSKEDLVKQQLTTYLGEHFSVQLVQKDLKNNKSSIKKGLTDENIMDLKEKINMPIDGLD